MVSKIIELKTYCFLRSHVTSLRKSSLKVVPHLPHSKTSHSSSSVLPKHLNLPLIKTLITLYYNYVFLPVFPASLGVP